MSSASIRDIALRAQVSVSTVSKVLNNKSDVAQETRRRVLSVIDELKYRRRVSSVNGRIVGVFFPFGVGVKLSNPYMSTIIYSAADQLVKLEYRVELISTHGVPKTSLDFQQFCTNSNIEAALFVMTTLSDQYIAEIADTIPVVVTANRLQASSATIIGYDAYRAASDATTHLVDLGHKRLAFVCEDHEHRDQLDRLRGFADTIKRLSDERGTDITAETISLDEEDLRQFLHRSMSSSDPPTGLVISNDLSAMRAIEIVSSMGLSVPTDVSIVGFDDLPFSRYLRPSLTTVRQPIYEIGRLAGEEIHRRICGDASGSGSELLLEGSLIVRESTGVAKGAK